MEAAGIWPKCDAHDTMSWAGNGVGEWEGHPKGIGDFLGYNHGGGLDTALTT